MKNKKCEKCKVIYNGKQCPVCGTDAYSKKIENNGKPKRRFYKKWWFWVIISIIIVFYADVLSTHRDAVEKAEYLINSRPYSREHLIEGLEQAGFTYENAVYGADHCDAYWAEQAVKAAKQYIEDSDEEVSLNDLLDKLENDGFMGSEAIYAAEQNGYYDYE